MSTFSLIKATTTANGLKVEPAIDPNVYPAGINVSDEEMEPLKIKRESLHGNRKYTKALNRMGFDRLEMALDNALNDADTSCDAMNSWLGQALAGSEAIMGKCQKLLR